MPLIIQVVLAGLTATAGFSDLRSRRIPNWLVFIGLVFGLGLNFYVSGWSGLGRCFLGAGLAAAVYLPLFALRAMGGGDAKLMIAVGALAGPWNWFLIFLLTAVIGGVVAVTILLFKGILRNTLGNVAHILNELVHLRAPHGSAPQLSVEHPKAVTLPHGAVIAAGTLLFLVLLRTNLLDP
jgi:prepilin peptidase CpaA